MQELAQKTDLHLKRKLWHIVTGLAAVFITVVFHFDSYDAALAAFLIGFSGLLFEIARLKVPKLNELFIAFAGGVLRERERNQVSGFIYYCFGVSFTFFFYPFEIAFLAVFFLIFADPMAALVGTMYGKVSLIKGKSLEGSLACFFVCALLSGVFLQLVDSPVHQFAFIMVGGLSGMLAEMVTFMDDNLSLPLISGFLLSQGHYLLI